MNDGQSKEPNDRERYTREDIEQSRAEEAEAKLHKLIDESPKTHQDMTTDSEGITYVESVVDIEPPVEGDSLLKNYGYSQVRIGRMTSFAQDGSARYPWAMIIETSDDKRHQKDEFFLLNIAGNKRLMIGDETAGSVPTGIDRTTGEVSHDAESFDKTLGDMMLPVKLRLLEGNEYANLISIIIACETDDR